MNKTLIIVLAVAAILVFWLFGSYNSLVSSEEGVDAQWANVENVYKRRADLIPNLVATVKGYAEHEEGTLIGVVEARAKATAVSIDPSKATPQQLMQYQQAQDGLSQALGKLMVVVERYPDLKANQNFRDLQAQLEGTENRIAVERRKFNGAAKIYNTNIRKFPKVVLASMFGFERKAYFEAPESASEAPTVKF